MRWFGKSYRAPVYHSIERTATPVGEDCSWCFERITEGDDGFELPFASPLSDAKAIYYHRQCFLRTVLGSVSHIERLCSCFVSGSECSDPPGMSKREAATAAVKAYEKYEGVPLT
ncbi:MAG TPA: hypothetical protein VH439_17145 [Gemmatimonadales bacterium]|jgi:hypothetical protein